MVTFWVPNPLELVSSTALCTDSCVANLRQCRQRQSLCRDFYVPNFVVAFSLCSIWSSQDHDVQQSCKGANPGSLAQRHSPIVRDRLAPPPIKGAAEPEPPARSTPTASEYHTLLLRNRAKLFITALAPKLMTLGHPSPGKIHFGSAER